jgi:hypothetical protein
MLVTPHFSVAELTHGRGWWSVDPAGELARYERLAVETLEPIRLLLGVPLQVLSGARPAEHNDGGRASSMHLPPVQRAAPQLRYMARPPADRGAACDFVAVGLQCDAVYHAIDAAMQSGRLPHGGLFWYASTPGQPPGGRFVHVDNRGTLARERALTPPR